MKSSMAGQAMPEENRLLEGNNLGTIVRAVRQVVRRVPMRLYCIPIRSHALCRTSQAKPGVPGSRETPYSPKMW
eukprot:2533077-Amphidinium_carterae.1